VKPKKQPRWTIAFLRALERTGDVRASAEDAGIDHSTAYARRRTHSDFARDWQRALRAQAERVEREREEELEQLKQAPPRHVRFAPDEQAPTRPLHHPADGPPPHPSDREELMGAGAQVRRAGHDRWSARKEKLFFDELAATANVKHSAKAAGVSPNAVYQRRLRNPHFKAKWAAVLETGRAAIEMHLVEAANRTFDPDELDVGDVQPKVSITDAIRIAQLHGSKAERSAVANPFQSQALSDGGAEGARERLFKKLMRLKKRRTAERLADGWVYDEEHGLIVPPGWVKQASS
jgi:hypothetical protein